MSGHTPPCDHTALGIDIGGANTKAATADGKYVEAIYLPLWRGADLAGALRKIAADAPAGASARVGVTITGELADCFATKGEGVSHIATAVKSVFPDAVFYGHDGRFYEETDDYRPLAAANWSASARYVGRVHRDVLFVDVGSTTTDVIPVVGGQPVAGSTDFERLCRDELIYAGALRTNLAALLPTVEVRGCTARTAPELFAVTGDVYLLLGRLAPEDYTCDTPDGRGRGPEDAARRIARLVCCDLAELEAADVMAIVSQAHARQRDDLAGAIRRTAERHGLTRAAICGLGSFLARDALGELGMPFAPVADERISRVFPAYAVANQLEEKRDVT
ncbi:MAG TPA: hydantoinase/oxoprolinase family protein [Methanocella sp.]|nr:hydantoinase/oxoprolinase family protein [Methanocella sp.]